MADKLPPRLKALYDALDGQGEVPVETLYIEMFGETDLSERAQAQKLGTYVARLNDRIEDDLKIVEPGRTKYTYALKSLD